MVNVAVTARDMFLRGVSLPFVSCCCCCCVLGLGPWDPQKAQYDAEVLHDRIGILEDRARSYEAQITVFQQRRDKDGAKIARLERELDKKAKVGQPASPSVAAVVCCTSSSSGSRRGAGAGSHGPDQDIPPLYSKSGAAV